MTSKTTIYEARKVLTMSPSLPTASHVAVRGRRILGAGTLDQLEGWGPYELDDRFRDKIILPGFVEGHSHTLDGVFWAYHYVGFFPRTGRTAPNGRVVRVLKRLWPVCSRL